MSLKAIVEKVSDNHYVLPKIDEMKCQVDAFLSEKLFAESEETCWKQIKDGASYPGIIGAYLMPDCHTGFTIPIGAVLVSENVLIQSVNGVDTGCGIILMKVNGLSVSSLRSKYERRRFVEAVEKRICPQRHQKVIKPNFNIEDVLRYGAKSIGTKSELCERQFISIDDRFDLKKIEKAYDGCLNQLGTIGGGNHFFSIENDINTGDIYVMIHSGSRSYGHSVANHFFYEGAKLRNIPSNRRETSWLYADEPLGKEYWNYINSAANFAISNRHYMVQIANEALEEIYGATGEIYYETSHNLIQEETLFLPDGSTKKGFVARKGATRAFPAGHPDLKNTKWFEIGAPCLIPGSAFSGSAILFPQKDAWKSSHSVNHGSGRILARGAAKRKLEHKQQFIDEQMNTVQRNFNGTIIEGIVSNYRKTPLDECDHVYKDLDNVLSVLEAENIAKVSARLYPVVNIKSAD